MASILLVEDNEMNRDMLSRRLADQGYRVSTAANGRLGVDAARAQLPNLILMDMSLPEMHGWDATRQLKLDATTQHIPIIALTAHAMASDRQEALAAGCDEYETKPVEFVRLLAKIEDLLRVAQSTE